MDTTTELTGHKAEGARWWPAGHQDPGGTAAGPPPPHGGVLVDRLVDDEERKDAARQARELRSLPLTARAFSDLEALATGVLSPLTGFMTRDDYGSVLRDLRLSSPGRWIWPLPIVLPVPADAARGLSEGETVALVVPDASPYASITVTDVFTRDLVAEARAVYGTDDPSHPGVAHTLADSPVAVGGPVRVWRRPPAPFPGYASAPAETRALFARRGWRSIAGFQTRNPVHRAHEYIQKCALELVDGLLLHPLVGETRGEDLPAAVRMRSYEVLIRHYFPADRVVLAVFPVAMRYAGPREAVFHAICRKNYGCTHFIVGRDHAGVGNHYGPFAAQDLVRQLQPELGIAVLAFDNAFYCRRCGNTATAKTCPHSDDAHLSLSGTAVRTLLRQGRPLPPEFSRPEVIAVLAQALGLTPADDPPRAVGDAARDGS